MTATRRLCMGRWCCRYLFRERTKPVTAVSSVQRAQRRHHRQRGGRADGDSSDEEAAGAFRFDEATPAADVPPLLSLASTIIWLCSTAAFVPLLRVLLGALDCTQQRDGTWTWDRDSSCEYNLLTPHEQAARLRSGPLYAGDFPCFEGVHMAVYVRVRAACGLVLGCVVTVCALFRRGYLPTADSCWRRL